MKVTVEAEAVRWSFGEPTGIKAGVQMWALKELKRHLQLTQ